MTTLILLPYLPKSLYQVIQCRARMPKACLYKLVTCRGNKPMPTNNHLNGQARTPISNSKARAPIANSHMSPQWEHAHAKSKREMTHKCNPCLHILY